MKLLSTQEERIEILTRLVSNYATALKMEQLKVKELQDELALARMTQVVGPRGKPFAADTIVGLRRPFEDLHIRW